MKPFEERKNEFVAEYGKLREKYQCDILSVPNFIPNEKGTWDFMVTPQIMDLAAPVPSNFSMEKN